MNILWVTPIGARSAIGRFSTFVVDELVKLGHDVVVVGSEWKPSPDSHPFVARTFHSAASFLEGHQADAFDVIVANFGDHFPNHVGALHFLGHSRMIGIFHDADMSNFGNGVRAFGADIAPPLPAISFANATVTGAVARLCAGAVTHSPFYAHGVDTCDGPVAIIPLAWAIAPSSSPTAPSSPEGRVRITTIGNINRNKCADRLIEALGLSDSLKGRCDYRLVGAIEDKEREFLTSLAAEKGVSLTILGPVDDPTLDAEIMSADIISCLREPVLEGASASAIESMMHGKAVMVSYAGFYLELPADCVIRIPAETRPEDICRALEKVADDPEERARLAARAKAFALDVFSPKRYAGDLVALAEEVRALSAYQPVLSRLAGQLAALGLGPSSPAAGFILDQMEHLIPIERRVMASDLGNRDGTP